MIFVNSHQFVKKPFIIAEYAADYENIVPCPGESFLVKIDLKNTEDYPIYGLKYAIPLNVTGIELLNSTNLIFVPKLDGNEVKTFYISYLKTDPGIYMLPPVSFQ